MKRYEKYKPTGIQWLPEIPEHWNIESFGKHFSFGKGLPITKADLTKEGIAVISYGQVHSKLNLGVTLSDSLIRYVSNRWLDTNPQNLLRKCDFVFADTSEDIAGAGNCAFNDYSKPLFAGYHIVIARPTMVENSHYWAYLFQSNCWKSQVQSLVNGVKVYSINKSILKKTAILIPSIAEQEKIVAYLDKRITLIEDCKCQRERELQTLNELKQAEIASVVTRGLNPDVPMKDSGIPWIGQIPVHWDMKYLFQVAHEHYISNKDIHHQNLLSLSYGKIVHKDINTTEGLLPASFDTYQIIEPGNIVFRFTDLQNDHKSLRVGLSKETGIITSAYIAVEVDTIYILPEYFYYTLHSFDIKKLFYSMGGGLRQSLNYNGIRKLYLPIPPLEEQKAIVSFVDNKIKKIEVMIQSLESEIDRLTEYKQRLISDVVTGQIDVRGEQIQ